MLVFYSKQQEAKYKLQCDFSKFCHYFNVDMMISIWCYVNITSRTIWIGRLLWLLFNTCKCFKNMHTSMLQLKRFQSNDSSSKKINYDILKYLYSILCYSSHLNFPSSLLFLIKTFYYDGTFSFQLYTYQMSIMYSMWISCT